MRSLNQNNVQLIGVYGGDRTHVMSAWTSTTRAREATDEEIGKLLKFLAENEHGTPFEKSMIHFLICTDVATHIHLIKHRVGVSCLSADTEIYIPRPVGKRGGNSGYRVKTIKQLYQEYTNGILSRSKNGKPYYRKYGRPTPVRSKMENDFEVCKSYVEDVYYNGVADVYKITTKSGYSIESTLEHQFYSKGGFVSLRDLLDVEMVGGIATMKNKGASVLVNGVSINVEGRPWTFEEFFKGSEKYTRIEFANLKGINYSTCKKWGYIFDIQFKKDPDAFFNKGHVPWNKNRYGYKINRPKKGLNHKNITVKRHKNYKTWRASVGNWTREQLPKLLDKYGYVCQAQLCNDSEGCSRNFECHHVIPVSVDKKLALDFGNLLLVCGDCHKAIHSTRSSEEKCAKRFTELGSDALKTKFSKRKKRTGNKLRYVFDEVVSIEHVGKKEVYDLKISDTHCYVANGFLVHNCNTESSRYKELKDDKGYTPLDWPESEQERHNAFVTEAFAEYHACIERLTASGMNRKRAKETARYYLPYANQIVQDVSFNFRSFVHFYHLRADDHAQREIAHVAEEMRRLIQETGEFDASLRAFGLYV